MTAHLAVLFDEFIQEVAMGAPSSEVEARQIAATLDRMPRAREVSERLSALIDAPSTTKEQRIRYEALEVGIAYTLKVGIDISQAEHGEWMALLPDPR